MNSIAATSRLCGRFVAREAINAATANTMFVLLRSHFLGVDRETFEQDLRGKNWVILLEDERGILRGFSTLLVYPDSVLERPLTVVYSGDTIVAREWWGSPALALTWLRAVRQLTPLYGSRDVYWILLTSGFRTYRFLPVFFREFYPRADGLQGTMAQLRDAIALSQFGDRYDPASGIVRLERPQVLAPELIEVPAQRALDPHVRFFLEQNPGYLHGDELTCITRIAEANLTAAGRRVLRSV